MTIEEKKLFVIKIVYFVIKNIKNNIIQNDKKIKFKQPTYGFVLQLELTDIILQKKKMKKWVSN